MPATGQPCSSANSRNASQDSARWPTGPIGSGDTSAMPLWTRYATSVSRKPNHSLSSRNAKYDSESVPYFSTMNRARSRESGRYDESRGTTAGRNKQPAEGQRDTDADCEQRGRQRSGRGGRRARSSCTPTSRSATASLIFADRQIRMPQRDADRAADDGDNDAHERDAERASPRRRVRRARRSRRGARTRKTTTISATTASSTSRPLTTLPTTDTSSNAIASSPRVALTAADSRTRAAATRCRRSRPTRRRPPALRSA